MIVSRFGESYDTANISLPALAGAAKAEFQKKPVWCVRSLRALNKAIQQTRVDEAQRHDEERDRMRQRVDQRTRERQAADLRAHCERRRNPWENN